MKVVGKDAMGIPLVQPDPPQCEGPVAETFPLPEDEKYFTVERIIELAAKFFGFYNKSEKAEHNARRKFEIYGNYNTIKKYVYRTLKDKDIPSQQKPNHSKVYSRETVHEFLSDYSNQIYFLKKGIEGNKEELKQLSDKKRNKKGSKHGQTPEKEGLERTIEQVSKQLDELKRRYDKLLASDKEREHFVEESLKFLENRTSSEEDTETPIDSIVEEYKKKILFQFLFDSLIDFEEKMLRDDIKHLPEIEDALAADNEQIQAKLRLEDLHNYYKGKLNLVDTLEKLLEAKKAPEKPNYGTFKE